MDVDMVILIASFFFAICFALIAFYQTRVKKAKHSLFHVIISLFIIGNVVDIIFYWTLNIESNALLWRINFSVSNSISAVIILFYWYFAEKMKNSLINKTRLVVNSLIGLILISTSIAFVFFNLNSFWDLTFILHSIYGTVVFCECAWIFYHLYLNIDHSFFTLGQVVAMVSFALGYALTIALFYNNTTIFWLGILLYYVGFTIFSVSHSINVEYPFNIIKKINSEK